MWFNTIQILWTFDLLSVASLLNRRVLPLLLSELFISYADGFQLLLSKLESFDKNSIIIVLESMAHYGDNLVRYLVAEF